MILPSTILTVVAESAARSLLLAGAVGAGLLLLCTRNVPARKAAWMLVLAASFAMPLLAHWGASAARTRFGAPRSEEEFADRPGKASGSYTTAAARRRTMRPKSGARSFHNPRLSASRLGQFTRLR